MDKNKYERETSMNKKKIALAGCGNLGSIITARTLELLSGKYEFIGFYDFLPEKAEELAKEYGGIPVKDIDSLSELKADFVIEATNPDACKRIAEAILAKGSSLIPLSTGAFADDDFRSEAAQLALENDARIFIPSGAIGGLDIMQAATLNGDIRATIINQKAPNALAGAPFLKGRTLSETEEELLFCGSAREAIREFPHNVNVAITLALLTSGMDDTKVEIRSVPDLPANSHRIILEGTFGRADLLIESAPSKGNARSSEIAAWSVVALLKKLSDPITY